MAGARPAQGGGRAASPKLCKDCRHLNLDQFDLNAIPVQLCVEGSTLKKPIKDWGDFLDDVLNRVCAARNTLEGGRHTTSGSLESTEGRAQGTEETRGKPPKKSPYYALLIHIEKASTAESYTNDFSERIWNRLKPMLMEPDFSKNVHIKMVSDEAKALWFLSVSILGAFDGVVAKDFRSPQSLNHGLLDANLDCIVHHLFCGTDLPNHMFQRPQGLEGKSNGDHIAVQECESIQFKSLQRGEAVQNVRRRGRGQPQERFDPQNGGDYVDWLWTKQTQPLGKYIAAFAKIHAGGAFYCGVGEAGGKNKIQALELSDEWRREIEDTLETKIKEDMLWVRRDPENERGYTLLEADDIKKGQHFDVGFIPVEDPKTSNGNLYILEVKVASFDGVVFNNRGPEVYVFEKEEGTDVYHPVPLAATDWLAKLQQHAWCSRHRRPRQPRCGCYDKCSKCQEVRSPQGCCEELESCCDKPSCREA